MQLIIATLTSTITVLLLLVTIGVMFLMLVQNQRKYAQNLLAQKLLHDKELDALNTKYKKNLLNKIAFLERKSTKSLSDVRVGRSVQVVQYPVHERAISPFSELQEVSTMSFQQKQYVPKLMHVPFIDSNLSMDEMKRIAAKEMASWMIENDFVFAKIERKDSSVRFGFMFYE